MTHGFQHAPAVEKKLNQASRMEQHLIVYLFQNMLPASTEKALARNGQTNNASCSGLSLLDLGGF